MTTMTQNNYSDQEYREVLQYMKFSDADIGKIIGYTDDPHVRQLLKQAVGIHRELKGKRATYYRRGPRSWYGVIPGSQGHHDIMHDSPPGQEIEKLQERLNDVRQELETYLYYKSH